MLVVVPREVPKGFDTMIFSARELVSKSSTLSRAASSNILDPFIRLLQGFLPDFVMDADNSVFVRNSGISRRFFQLNCFADY